MFDLVSDDDFSYIEIVESKYLHLNQSALQGLCNKFDMPVFWGTQGFELAKTIIPKSLTSDGFLKKFYYKLEANEKKILKFIVNYSGDDIQRAVKKKFKFDIVLMVRRKTTVYIWWLELFIDSNKFEEVYKEIFLEFLSENRQQKNSKNKRVNNNNATVVTTTQTIQNVTLNKYTISHDLYPQVVQEIKAEDTILAINMLYSLADDSRLKVTQKRTLAVRSEKILIEKMPKNYNYIWLINLLTDNGYLKEEQLRAPTSKFHKMMAKSDADIIKIIFKVILNSKTIDELSYTLFRVSLVQGDYVKKFRDMILELISKEDKSLWISVDYLVDKIKIDSKTLKYITNDYNYCYAFKGSSLRYTHNKIEHLKVVVRYFLKTFFGIMSRVGLCDLGITEYQVYAQADVRILQGIDEVGYPYLNVEFYKLTQLGQYVLGLGGNYESANDYKLILNSYNYEVKVQNPNKLSDIYLEKIAKKTDDLKYKVDIKTFMNNIKSKIEYQNVKNTFLSKTEDVPQNWKKFFATLDSREESAVIVSKSAVLIKIKNDKEVLKLISSNTKLQDKILKADRFHVVVMQNDLLYVRNIFKEYGIII